MQRAERVMSPANNRRLCCAVLLSAECCFLLSLLCAALLGNKSNIAVLTTATLSDRPIGIWPSLPEAGSDAMRALHQAHQAHQAQPILEGFQSIPEDARSKRASRVQQQHVTSLYALGCKLHPTMWGGRPRIGSTLDSAASPASLLRLSAAIAGKLVKWAAGRVLLVERSGCPSILTRGPHSKQAYYVWPSSCSMRG